MGSICSSNNGYFISVGKSKPNVSASLNNSFEFSAKYSLSERFLSREPECQVRLCKRNSTERIYVAKIISRCSKNSFLEAQILKKLDHPNILKIIGYYHDTSKNYLILEYLSNGDLLNFLKRIIKLPEKTAAGVMQQILSAVNYCHDKGIVHRDIKPENILIDTIGKKGIHCKLADFDSAGILDKTETGVYGTLYYTAPEVFDGKYDEKVDIWSCGVMMYQLITGKYLFCGTNLKEIQSKIKSKEIIFEDAISTEAKDLLKKMLTRNSRIRISAKDACNHP